MLCKMIWAKIRKHLFIINNYTQLFDTKARALFPRFCSYDEYVVCITIQSYNTHSYCGEYAVLHILVVVIFFLYSSVVARVFFFIHFLALACMSYMDNVSSNRSNRLAQSTP